MEEKMEMEEKLLEIVARSARSAERYKLYALRAKKDEQPRLASLFLAIAESHAMQSKRFLMQIRGAVGTTAENEQKAFAEDIPAAVQGYELLLEEAEGLGSKALQTGFRHSGDVEKHHLELYNRMKEREQETEYYVCDFCGYVAEDEPPENCPVCTAPTPRFKKP